MSPHEKKFISLDYELIYRIETLPQPIRQLIRKQVGRMANPDEFYNGGCSITPGVPRVQLIYAGVSEDFGFVSYRRGGFIVTEYLLLFDIKGDRITISSKRRACCANRGIDALKNYLKGGR